MELVGKSDPPFGRPGVYGGNDGGGPGVAGETNGHGPGVFGQSASGVGVEGRSNSRNEAGVLGWFSDWFESNPAVVPALSSGVRGVVGLQEDVPTDGEGRKQAAGVIGESGAGGGFGYGVLGIGIRDAGVAGFSEKSTGVAGRAKRGAGVAGTSEAASGGRFEGFVGAECSATRQRDGETGPGLIAASHDRWGGEFSSGTRGQIRLVPRDVDFGQGEDGAPYPLLPRFGVPGEIIAVRHPDDSCSLWLCVERANVLACTWARVELGSVVSGEV
ncbi:hypothetical protein ACFVU3_10815 [Streptomyces sp. NPDC058052]|uniref:hypothetical protein n=1 Tax=Streptomyces sp. NPDC058052 TaxID=3346316 RepID=UPI0036EFEE86